MSRIWSRAAIETHCGSCRKEILVGHPLLTMQLAQLDPARKFYRCQECAMEPVPKDLPALPAHKTVRDLAPMTPARVLARGTVLPLDYSARRLGEREPGEEG